MEIDQLKTDIGRRMEGALEVLQKEFAGLRTGRASISLLQPVTVEAYGQPMPMDQVGTIGVPEARLLTIQVWDKGLVSSVEKAIRDSNLGLNPVSDGQLVRVPIPPLSEERRVELTKVAGRYTEEAKVAIRNVRRHAMDNLKKAEKDGSLSEDSQREYGDDVQKLTDAYVTKMDEALAKKEEEILQV